jgi:hypothetical protein
MQSGFEAIGTEDLTVGTERGGIGGSFICRTDFSNFFAFLNGENRAFRRSVLFLRDHFPTIAVVLLDDPIPI